MQVTAYWQAVSQKEKALVAVPEPIFITSIDKPLEGLVGGSTCEATRHVAAMRLVAGTHQLSTEQDIKKFREDQSQRAEDCAITELRNKPSAVLITQERAQQAGIQTKVPAAK